MAVLCHHGLVAILHLKNEKKTYSTVEANRELIRGAKYLVFVSSRSLKTRELSFAQFVYYLRKLCLFLNDKIHNYVKQNIIVKLKNLTHFSQKV